MEILVLITVIIVSYLIGSIPTAYIFGRLLKGIDIRKCGSGNVGATNAMRVLGKKAGISVLLIDILKGFTAVFFLGNIVSAEITFVSYELLNIMLGLSCIIGHNWTIFLQFKGGKGMATTLGVLAGLTVKIAGLRAVLGLSILVWLVVFLIVRIVSVASVMSAIALPILTWVFKQSGVLIFSSIVLSALAVFRHKSNLKRVLKGEEKRLF